MRRDDGLLAVANLSVIAFLMLAGPSMAIAAADPGGAHDNGGHGKSGSSQGGAARTGSGNSHSGSGAFGNGGSATRGNSGGHSSASGQTNTGSSSNGRGGGNGNGNGNGHDVAAGAQSTNGSDGTDSAPPFAAPPPVVVAEQHTGTTAGGSWWAAPAAVPLTVEVRAQAAPREEGATDLLSADHAGVPVWAAAEPVGMRGDLFGLAGLVLMPLVGLAVGYRQAKAAREAGLTIRP